MPTESGHPFVLLEDLALAFAAELFPGYEVLEKGLLRITRGAEMTLDEEKDEDFMRVMSEALRKRQQGAIVRLEISAPGDLRQFFKDQLNVAGEDVYENRSWFDLRTFSQLSQQPGFESAQTSGLGTSRRPGSERTDDLWTLLKQKEVLLFHPYESFDMVTHLWNGRPGSGCAGDQANTLPDRLRLGHPALARKGRRTRQTRDRLDRAQSALR